MTEGILKPDLYEPELNQIYSSDAGSLRRGRRSAPVADPTRKECVEDAIQHTQGLCWPEGARDTGSLERVLETLGGEFGLQAHPRQHAPPDRGHVPGGKPHLRPLPVTALHIFTQVIRAVATIPP